jgi:AraC family transcriptional regulator
MSPVFELTGTVPGVRHSASGVVVDVRNYPPGMVKLRKIGAHLLKMHVGRSVRGTCGLGRRFLYANGDLDLFPEGTSSVWENEDASEFILVRLPSTLLLQTATELALDPLHALEPRYCFRSPQIEHVLIALDSERAAGFPSGPLYVESLALALAIQLLGGYPAGRNRRDGLSTRKLRLVTNHIESHLGENLPLAALAVVAGLSVSHFRTLFKLSTGLPVHEYLIQRRVARARSLLLQGRVSASEAALEAGFAHQSHLARCMRRVLGVTPSQLVRQREDQVPQKHRLDFLKRGTVSSADVEEGLIGRTSG